MTEKFIGYFRLIEACEQGGCLVCRCVEEDGRRHLDALMYEQVNDPTTRRRLHASWGFCNWHTWMLPEIPNAASGAAIIYEDLFRVFLHRVGRLRDRVPSLSSFWRGLRRRRRPVLAELYRRRQPCLVCAWCAEAETGYLLTLLRFVDDPQFARAYAKSDGVCVPHMLDAVELGAGTPGLGHLFDRTLPKWEDLRKDLDRFIWKHDYRNTDPFTGPEVSSYRRALEALAGRRELWGSDVHGPPPVRAAAWSRRRRVAAPTGAEPDAIDDAFERGRLELRVQELTQQLNETMSRAAALHYRLSRVAEDRDVLELNLSGERGTNELARRTLEDLRAENERLHAELAAARGAPLASRPREG